MNNIIIGLRQEFDTDILVLLIKKKIEFLTNEMNERLRLSEETTPFIASSQLRIAAANIKIDIDDLSFLMYHLSPNKLYHLSMDEVHYTVVYGNGNQGAIISRLEENNG